MMNSSRPVGRHHDSDVRNADPRDQLLIFIMTSIAWGGRETRLDAIMMALNGAIGPKDNGDIPKDNAVSAYLDA